MKYHDESIVQVAADLGLLKWTPGSAIVLEHRRFYMLCGGYTVAEYQVVRMPASELEQWLEDRERRSS